MYKSIFKVFIIGVFLSVSSFANAQSGCKSIKNKCDGFGEPYKYSGQSKSGVFELGQSSEFKMTTYGGFEYSVSLCADKQLKGIFFRIKEKSNNGTVLYDGQAEGDEMNWKQFYIEDSKSLIIEVVVPEGDESKGEIDYEDTYGCVAIIIEYNKIGKKGFN